MTQVIQEAGDARLAVDLDNGARIASVQIAGHELLVTQGPTTFDWGCYPMAPWPNRVRHGRFSFEGAEYRMPVNFGPHAIHGTVLDRAWRARSNHEFAVDLAPPWPWRGEVRQHVRLEPESLHLRMEVHAAEPMPAAVGWHPWFRRTMANSDVALDFTAGYMEVRDDEMIPTGERAAPPPPGPWDDCFGDVAWPVTLTWPGVLQLEMTSDCSHLVVYDGRDHAVCVEPQTAPANILNRTPQVVEPGSPLVAESTWRWRLG